MLRDSKKAMLKKPIRQVNHLPNRNIVFFKHSLNPHRAGDCRLIDILILPQNETDCNIQFAQISQKFAVFIRMFCVK